MFQQFAAPYTQAWPAWRWSFVANTLLTTLILIGFDAGDVWHALAYGFILTAIPHLLVYAPLPFAPVRLCGEALRYTFLLTDLAAFHRVGVHLDDPQLVQSLADPALSRDLGLHPQPFLMLSAWLVLAVVAQWQIGRVRPKRTESLGFLLAGVAALLLLGHLSADRDQRVRMSEVMPLYDRLERATAVGTFDARAHLDQRRSATRYPLQPMPAQDLTQVQRPDVLFVLAETLRADMLNPVDMPQLASLTSEATLVSAHHFAGTHCTREATFTAIYALGAWQYETFAAQAWRAQPIQMFHDLGYETVAIASGQLRFPNHEALLAGFDRVIDFSLQPALQGDPQATDAALDLFVKRRALPVAQQKPLMIVLFYDATHYAYNFPPAFAQHQPVAEAEAMPVTATPEFRLGLWNRYRNAVRFVDSEIGRLLAGLQPERDAKRLAWLVVGDHGEEFWDLGQFGHTARRLNAASAETPLVFSYPGMARRTVQLSAHVDLFPTLFDLMGVRRPPRDYSDGQSLLGPPRRYVQINAYGFPDHEAFALVNERLKVFVQRSDAMVPEIARVLSAQDEPIAWQPDDVTPLLAEFSRDVDRMQPNFKLFRAQTPRVALLPRPTLPPAQVGARTRAPEELPWVRSAL
jgi:membrane-anchored protein YejM (alkaline phosphatase superfamily)